MMEGVALSEDLLRRMEEELPEKLADYEVHTLRGPDGGLEFDVERPDEPVGDTLFVKADAVEQTIQDLQRLRDAADAAISILQEHGDTDG